MSTTDDRLATASVAVQRFKKLAETASHYFTLRAFPETSPVFTYKIASGVRLPTGERAMGPYQSNTDVAAYCQWLEHVHVVLRSAESISEFSKPDDDSKVVRYTALSLPNGILPASLRAMDLNSEPLDTDLRAEMAKLASDWPDIVHVFVKYGTVPVWVTNWNDVKERAIRLARRCRDDLRSATCIECEEEYLHDGDAFSVFLLATDTERLDTPAKGSAVDDESTRRAQVSRIFRDGPLDDEELTTFIYKLDAGRDGKTSDAVIARRITGETTDKDPNAVRLLQAYRKRKREGLVLI